MKSQREKSCFKKAKFNILCTDLGRKCIYFTKPQFYLLAKSFELRWKWIPCMYKYVGTNIVSFLLKWRLWLKNSFHFTPWLHFSSHVTSKTFIQKTWSTENPGAFQSHTHVVRMRPVDCCEIFSQFYSSLYIVITCLFFNRRTQKKLRWDMALCWWVSFFCLPQMIITAGMTIECQPELRS